MDINQTKSEAVVEKTIKALGDRGISAQFASSPEEAKDMVLEIVPEGAEIMTMTSITLDETGISEELNSDRYNSVRQKLNEMDRETQNDEMQKLGAAPEWVAGSVHAVTEDGQVLVASNTGSQLPAYVYGSPNVVWVVGTQKIVKDLDEGMKRLDAIVPLESERAREAYNLPDFNTNLSKILIVNKETSPDRVRLIFVDEAVGF